MAEEDRSKPATKGDLLALEARLTKHIRDSQTEILRALERYSASDPIKFHRLRADVSNIDASTDERLALVEQRLAEIEKRLLLRPRDAA